MSPYAASGSACWGEPSSSWFGPQGLKDARTSPGGITAREPWSRRVQLTSSANNPATMPAPSAVMIQITAAAVAVSITLRKLMD